jgi:hypothetical protein
MRIATMWLGILRRFGQKAGPYVMLELLMPGGTLLALLLYLCQRKRPDIARRMQEAVRAVARALAGIVDQRILVPAPMSDPYPRRCTTIRSER